MKPDNEPHYSMEFIEEDGKPYVLFYNADDKLVEKTVRHIWRRRRGIEIFQL